MTGLGTSDQTSEELKRKKNARVPCGAEQQEKSGTAERRQRQVKALRDSTHQ